RPNAPQCSARASTTNAAVMAARGQLATNTRQQARAALAALPPAARAFLEALHAGHFPPAPSRPVYTLEALLSHLAAGTRYGCGVERLPRALAAPVAYLWAVRDAAGLPACPGRG